MHGHSLIKIRCSRDERGRSENKSKRRAWSMPRAIQALVRLGQCCGDPLRMRVRMTSADFFNVEKIDDKPVNIPFFFPGGAAHNDLHRRRAREVGLTTGFARYSNRSNIAIQGA